MTRLDKIILLLTHWTVGETVETPEMADARWLRLTAGLPKTEEQLMLVISWIVNEIDGKRLDWTAYQGFMETKREETERLAAREHIAGGVDVVH